MFQLKGYDAGSLDDVASALDLGKASLYYYVRSKSELLYLVFDQAITRALDSLEALSLTELVDARERLEALVRHQIGIVASNPSLFAVFFDQRPRLGAEHEAEIRAKERRYLSLFTQAASAGATAGALPAVDSRYVAQLLLGMANWTYKWFDRERDDEVALADAAVLLVLGPARPV